MRFTIHEADKRHLRDINRLIVETNIRSAMKELEGRFWFARFNGSIVGCVGMEFVSPKTAIFTYLAVGKEYRHLGIGMSLHRHALASARKEGANVIAFITMYYHFNRFKKEGFKTQPRRFFPEDVREHWMFTAKRYMKCAAMIQEFSK